MVLTGPRGRSGWTVESLAEASVDRSKNHEPQGADAPRSDSDDRVSGIKE